MNRQYGAFIALRSPFVIALHVSVDAIAGGDMCDVIRPKEKGLVFDNACSRLQNMHASRPGSPPACSRPVDSHSLHMNQMSRALQVMLHVGACHEISPVLYTAYWSTSILGAGGLSKPSNPPPTPQPCLYPCLRVSLNNLVLINHLSTILPWLLDRR